VQSKRSAGRRPFRRYARSPRVRRVTFAPFARRIYDRPVRSAFGLRVAWPPHPPRGRLVCGSCSSGQSFAFSFLPASPREATVAVQLGVPGTQGPQRTSTSKSLPGSLSLPGSFARLAAGRAMPGAPSKKPRLFRGRGSLRRFQEGPVRSRSVSRLHARGLVRRTTTTLARHTCRQTHAHRGRTPASPSRD